MVSEEQDYVLIDGKDTVDYDAEDLSPQPLEVRERIRQWLKPTDYDSESSEYKKHITSHTAGTSNWMLDDNQYQTWLRSQTQGALWITAVAGAGKSVIAAQLVSQLACDSTVPVLYFFFRQIISMNLSPQSLIRDWMSQLLDFSPHLQTKLKAFIDDGGNRSLESVAFDELWQTLLASMKHLPHVFCVVDALDEMNIGNENFIHDLVQLGAYAPASIKLVVTSRPLPRIESTLGHESVVKLKFRTQVVDNDISIYVNTRLYSSEVPEDIKTAIRKAICDNSQGLFLYARLMMDDVIEKLAETPEVIPSLLNKLPSGLEEMYERTLQDHSVRSGVPQSLQMFILQCVTHSSRPLRLLELATILDIEKKSESHKSFTGSSDSKKDSKSIIRDGCGPLLEILEDESISIIHHSLTEFLVGSGSQDTNSLPHLNIVEAHRYLATICIQFLLSDWYDSWASMKDSQDPREYKRSLRMRSPFLDYAVNYWHYHIRALDQDDEDINGLLDILVDPSSNHYLPLLDFMDFDARPGNTDPLHILASKGLTHYLEHFCESHKDLDCRNAEDRTPLHLAASNGHHTTISTLIRKGATNDLDDVAGLKPLHLAANCNHSSVVRVLLESGVDPLTPKTKEHPGNWCGNAPTTTGETAVEYSARFGHMQSMRVFILFLDSDGLSRALCWSAEAGKSDLVRAILDSGRVDVNKKIDHKTPIHIAAHSHDIESMTLLLRAGSDVNIKCNSMFGNKNAACVDWSSYEDSFIALHAFADQRDPLFSPHKESIQHKLQGFRILLEAGSDINAPGSGRTALDRSVNSGPQIVKYLLDNGAAVTSPTLLHTAQDAETIEIIVAKGANVNALDSNDRTALFYPGSEGRALALLKHGADCNAQDLNGNTVLHVALGERSTSLSSIKAVLDYGANPTLRNSKGETPLHLLKYISTQKELLSILIAAGADLEAKTKLGLTVLLNFIASRSDYTPGLIDVKALLAAGARLDAQDYRGRTALHILCSQEQSAKKIRILLKEGADPLKCDFSGNTLLHYAAKQSPSYYSKDQLDLLELLLEVGISPFARNNEGQTPFHVCAAMNRHTSSYSTDPYDFLLGPKCKLDINTSDSQGIRPIHLAATISETMVARLLKDGADPAVITDEGQTVLHIASRNRQSNIVGLIVDHYVQSGKSQLIDHRDEEGRSALHYAARSGRAESVKVLLEAGANPNLKDKAGYVPLAMCAAFKEEDVSWSTRNRQAYQATFVDACYVTLDDPRRPSTFSRDSTPRKAMLPKLTSEYHSVGILQTIRYLIDYGADTSFMNLSKLQTGYHQRQNPFLYALASDCEILADELLRISACGAPEPTTQKIQSHNIDKDEPEDVEEWTLAYSTNHTLWNEYIFNRVALRVKTIPAFLGNDLDPHHDHTRLFTSLLISEDERALEHFQQSGINLTAFRQHEESCLETMAKWGYALFLEQFGTRLSNTNPMWVEEMESAAPGRKSLLHIACERSLPNLEVIRVLLDKFEVKMDAQYDETFQKSIGALHILAQSSHWWQAGALEYLLCHGADVDIKDGEGKTPLHIAVERKSAIAVDILLRYKANPNIVDEKGLSCLNKAESNTRIVQSLLKYGAELSTGKRPYIFDAIKSLSLNIVELLYQLGADFNVRLEADKVATPTDPYDKFAILAYMMANSRDPAEDSYPIHYAGSQEFNTPELREKMIPIIQCLLKGGADPFRSFNDDGDSILHDHCEREGILEPFLNLPHLDLEARDSQGRTLLLAACSTHKDWSVRSSNHPGPRLLFSKGADITAVDNKGRNILHFLLTSNSEYSWLRASDPKDLEFFLSQPAGRSLAVQKDKEGATPLHHALHNKQLWAVEPLLAHGADPIEQDPNGSTALHHLSSLLHDNESAELGKQSLVFFNRFLELGVDINKVNSLGETAMFNFFSHCLSLDELRLFTEAGADLMVENKQGQGLLHVAARRGGVQIFKGLMEKGLDPMKEDGEMRSAIDVAHAHESEEILEIFRREGQTKRC